MPSPNNAYTSATTISAFPYTVTETPADHSEILWWTFVAAADGVMGLLAWADNAAAYRPVARLYADGAPPTELEHWGSRFRGTFPVTAGTRYYISVEDSNTTEPLGGGLTLDVYRAPSSPVSAGAIFVNDDTTSYAAMIDSATGDVLAYTTSFPSGEAGDVLPSGIMCVHDGNTATQVKIYSPQLGLIATATSPVTGSLTSTIIRAYGTDTFLIAQYKSSTGATTLWTVSDAGVVGGTTRTIASTHVFSMAPDVNTGIVYYAITGNNQPVKRYDFGAGSALSDLAAGVANYQIPFEAMHVLADGTVVVGYYKFASPTAAFVRQYAAAGSTLNTYSLASDDHQVNRIARAVDDPTSFWVWSYPDDTAYSRFTNIRVSDGAALTTVTVAHFNAAADGYGGQGTVISATSPAFGPSFSCPFFVLTQDVTAPLQRVTQVRVLAAYDRVADADTPPEVVLPPDPGLVGACTGGGTVASGTNPDPGVSLATATTPYAWIEVTIGATVYRWAKIAINTAVPIEARVLSFGAVTRALTDSTGQMETASCDVQLSDHDRLLRGLMASGTLIGATADIYVADIATLRSGGTPWRVLRGVVKDFRPTAKLTFKLSIEDRLMGLSTSKLTQDRQVPGLLVSSAISDQSPTDKLIDKPVPMCYGGLSDEDQPTPIGTWECRFISTVTIDGKVLRRFLVSRGAVAQIQSLRAADPYSSTPTTRVTIGASKYGTTWWAPGMPGWLYPDDYDTSSGVRYTYVYGLKGDQSVELAKSGRVPLVANLCGIETVGDSTGDAIDPPPLILLHLLNNDVTQSATGDWLSIASNGDYSLFDTDTFTAAADVMAARGFRGAIVIAHDYTQQSLRDVIAAMCRSYTLFDLGVNHDGQVIATMLDRTSTASGVPHFTDQSDILADSFLIDPKTDAVEDQVKYVYGRNYLSTLADLTPQVNTRLPRDPYDGAWLSGLQRLGSGSSPVKVVEMDWIRDQATADANAQDRLDLRGAPRDEATFDLLLGRGLDLELGDVVKVTHFQGSGASGWVAKRCQVRRLVTNLDTFVVTPTVRDVDNLLA